MRGKQRILASAASLLLAAATILPTPVSAATVFNDVPSNHWAAPYIYQMAEKNIVAGVGNNMYAPSKALTGYEFLAMICNYFYKDTYEYYKDYYMEVDGINYKWTTPVWATAYYNLGDMPSAEGNSTIPRMQMAAIIYKLLQNKGVATCYLPDMNVIPDCYTIPEEYREAVSACYAMGLLTGVDSKGTFGGTMSLNRAQAATVMCAVIRAIETPSDLPEDSLIFFVDNVEEPDPIESTVSLITRKVDFEKDYMNPRTSKGQNFWYHPEYLEVVNSKLVVTVPVGEAFSLYVPCVQTTKFVIESIDGDGTLYCDPQAPGDTGPFTYDNEKGTTPACIVISEWEIQTYYAAPITPPPGSRLITTDDLTTPSWYTMNSLGEPVEGMVAEIFGPDSKALDNVFHIGRPNISGRKEMYVTTKGYSTMVVTVTTTENGFEIFNNTFGQNDIPILNNVPTYHQPHTTRTYVLDISDRQGYVNLIESDYTLYHGIYMY